MAENKMNEKTYCHNCNHSVRCFGSHAFCGKVKTPEVVNEFTGNVEKSARFYHDSEINKDGNCPYFEKRKTGSLLRRMFG